MDGSWLSRGSLREHGDSLPLAGGVCLHCGHWVTMTFIPGEPQSHTVWSAASQSQPGPGGRERAEGHECLGRPPLLSLSPLMSCMSSLSRCLTPHPQAACPLSLSLSPSAPGWGPSVPGHGPVCSWPLWLEGQPTPGREPFCWSSADSCPSLCHQVCPLSFPGSKRPPNAHLPVPQTPRAMFLPVRPEEHLHQGALRGPAKNRDAWLHLGG